MSFDNLIAKSVPPMERFWQRTLGRLLLSYVPLVDFISNENFSPQRIASFGSGSCAHETFLSYAFGDAEVFCHDVTDRFIPDYLRDDVLGGAGNIQFSPLDLEQDNVSLYREAFDFVFSIQTLEHIQNYRTFLELLSASVKPGGYLYLDAPYYHMDDQREDAEKLAAARARQWEQNEHYYLGFSPARLMEDPHLAQYSVLQIGYYSFESGDKQVYQSVNTDEHGRSRGTREFCTAYCGQLKAAIDAHDTQTNLDDISYFRRPANAFRMLLQKRR